MITGFNTDIEFEGKTYHVQTEDKGLARPVILSLVYDRGTILASKRLPYDDLLLNGGFDESVLAERLQKQHRLICAAVSTGRIDELKQMTSTESARRKSSEAALAATSTVSFTTSIDELPDTLPDFIIPGFEDPIPKPQFDNVVALHDEAADEFVDAITVIEDSIVVPDEAVEIVSEMVGRERPVNTKLSIEFLGDTKFRGGERKSIGFMICRGSERKVVPDAQIMVKILGSSFRPLIFHAKTDQNGIAKVNLQLPSFTEGRAAFLVRAMSDGEEVEIRRSVAHG